MQRKNIIGILLFMLPGIVAASDGAFKIDILSYPNRLSAGLGREVVDAQGNSDDWAQVDMRVRVSYLGSKPLPIIPAHCDGYQSGQFSVWARVRNENGEEVRSCVCPSVADVVYSNVGSLKPGWSKEYTVPLCLPGAGVYLVEVVVGEEIDSFKVVSGEIFELWKGQSTSDPVRVEVTALTGIDKRAYEALGPNVVADSHHWAELLRRFPTSTYAAYVVWKRYAEGTASVNAEKEAESTLRGPINEWGPGSCNLEGGIDGSQSLRFSGRKYVHCRSNWMEFALDHHPDIWFADEMRLKLALDAYLLNDKAACASKLEALSEHGKPFVGEKARALLEAMRAKNMLPGGPKELSAPAQAQSEGKAAQ